MPHAIITPGPRSIVGPAGPQGDPGPPGSPGSPGPPGQVPVFYAADTKYYTAPGGAGSLELGHQFQSNPNSFPAGKVLWVRSAGEYVAYSGNKTFTASFGDPVNGMRGSTVTMAATTPPAFYFFEAYVSRQTVDPTKLMFEYHATWRAPTALATLAEDHGVWVVTSPLANTVKFQFSMAGPNANAVAHHFLTGWLLG